ncbi:T9SS type A sorting domain-containing protein [Portibacter lacus]|uniref:Secretion system C-terminal sorting domain-containing protein n=1 Tax=Portibacter lacus TaxID=1099794 RepID=A0AA37SRS3_9BACT|nr:T9SS type A sorting domain-containing protein [Portibacter lacus]GLR19097.1 hypothetical protein GCM10007940_37130 [Portibacter lacus]
MHHFILKSLLFILIPTSFAIAQLPDSCKLNIGTNLSGVADYGTEIPFVNLMKVSREWYTKGVNDPDYQWDTQLASQLTYDENGYPTHIPQTIEGEALAQQVATVWDGTDGWPPGKYTLLWDGNGDFELWGGLTNLEKVNDNRYEFDYLDPIGGLLQIIMTYSDINNPVHNMRLLMPGTEDTYETQPFYQLWLDKLEPFQTVRFMDWGNTNFWGQEDGYNWEIPELADWDERAKIGQYTYTGHKGIPYEYMVELMNLKDIDGWVCIPHRASDDYIRKMADFFRDNVEDERHIYVEFSNEIWNWIFGQAQWLNKYGCVDKGITWPEGTVPYIQNALDHWTASFAEESERLTRVAAVQTGWLDVSERICYNLAPNTVDAISPAYYFSYNEESEAILDGLGANATVSDIAHHARLGFEPHMEWMRGIKSIADSIGVPLAFYEGGQHLTPNPFGVEPSYSQALLAIQRDTSMYNLYNEWFNQVRTLNDRNEPMLLMNFSFVNPRSARYGSWGVLETMDQDLSVTPAPKYQATIENMGCNSLSSSQIDIEHLSEPIYILPNPSSEEIRIIGLAENQNVQLYNASGILISTFHLASGASNYIDIRTRADGVYFLKFHNPVNGRISIEKFIKVSH